jgi:transcription antitermination factor NusG
MRHPYVFKISGSPFRAADKLLRFSVLPMNPCEYRFARKAKTGEAVLEVYPQLPGYFVGMFPVDRWFQIRNACYEDGSRVLGAPLSPDRMMRPILFSAWQTIMELNSYAEEAPVIERQRGLKAGDMVILRHGPHAGKRFRLQSASANGTKARIVMDFLGGLREVEIKADAVEVTA